MDKENLDSRDETQESNPPANEIEAKVVTEDEKSEPSDKVLQFQIDLNTFLNEVTVDEYIALTDSHVKITKTILARYISDGKGGVLPIDEGEKLIGSLSLLEQIEARRRLLQFVNSLAVNPTIGSNSNDTSEAT